MQQALVYAIVVAIVTSANGLCISSGSRLSPHRRLLSMSQSVLDPPSSSTKRKREALDVRIDDKWYDLSGWRMAHPAGEHWIDFYKGQDATEVMHGFHSERGVEMLKKLPLSKNAEDLDKQSKQVTSTTRNFRKLFAQLKAEGWWERDYVHEARLLGIWAALFTGGLFLAKTIPLLAGIMLGLANTNAGWIGHDYIHGVDKFSFIMRNFAAFATGMSPCWWSDKHNKHHAFSNHVGIDEDIATDPLLFVYPPAPEKDFLIARKIQHLTLPIPFSLLFFIWRIDSLILCVRDMFAGFKRKTQWEFGLLAAHYALMAAFVPLPVLVGSILFAGMMTATIVTVTHQSEDLFFDDVPDFVESQFRSTRNAICTTLFSDWLWGGMQWQLEHHLFPSMPRSKYPALSKIIRQFAETNNIEYRITNEWALIKKNWDMYRDVSSKPAVPGTKHFEKKNTLGGKFDLTVT